MMDTLKGLIVLTLWCFLWAKASRQIAVARGRNARKWFWIGWFAGCVGPVALYCMQPIKVSVKKASQKRRAKVRQTGVRAASNEIRAPHTKAAGAGLAARARHGVPQERKEQQPFQRKPDQTRELALHGWFFAQGGECKGPVSREKLLAFVQRGSLLQSALIWRAGMKQWTPFAEVARRLGWNSMAQSSGGTPLRVSLRQPGTRNASGVKAGRKWYVLASLGLCVGLIGLLAFRGFSREGQDGHHGAESLADEDIGFVDAVTEALLPNVTVPHAKYLSDSLYPRPIEFMVDGRTQEMRAKHVTVLSVLQDGSILQNGTAVGKEASLYSVVSLTPSVMAPADATVSDMPALILCADKLVRMEDAFQLIDLYRSPRQMFGKLRIVCTGDDVDSTTDHDRGDWRTRELPLPVSRITGAFIGAPRVEVEIVLRENGGRNPRSSGRESARSLGAKGSKVTGDELIWVVRGPGELSGREVASGEVLRETIGVIASDKRNWWRDPETNKYSPCIGVLLPMPDVSLQHLVTTMDILLSSGLDELAIADGRSISVDGGSESSDSRSTREGNRSDAAALALEWLVNHQDPDGRWDTDGFMKHDKDGESCDGPGNGVHDVGVTGLALLAFLGDGSTMRQGAYKENIKRGVMWLREQQNPDTGLFGTNASHDFIYSHAIAAYAMIEAYGLSQYSTLKKNAQLGLNYLESHRNPYAVWRYQPRDNDNDSSVTSWCLHALLAGKMRGLEVDDACLKFSAAWFDQVTDSTGRAGYSVIGEPSSRHPGDHGTRFPVEKGEAMTAVGLCCRFFMGQDPKETPVMNAAADLILSKPPIWDPKAGTIDHYYWYHASAAMARFGGRHRQEWQRLMETAAIKGQRLDGNFRGSWDPIDAWGEDGGRVYATSMMALALLAFRR